MAGPQPGDLMKEAFDPVIALFQNANTHEEYRKATVDSARHLVDTYFIKSGDFTLVEHGPLSTSIKTETGAEIASSADTVLLETRVRGTGATHAVLLAVNATMGEDDAAMKATVGQLGKVLNEWKRSRGLGSAFAIAMVRQNVSFFEWHAALAE